MLTKKDFYNYVLETKGVWIPWAIKPIPSKKMESWIQEYKQHKKNEQDRRRTRKHNREKQ